MLCNITDFISANYENVCFVGDYNLRYKLRVKTCHLNYKNYLAYIKRMQLKKEDYEK